MSNELKPCPVCEKAICEEATKCPNCGKVNPFLDPFSDAFTNIIVFLLLIGCIYTMIWLINLIRAVAGS